MAKQKRDRDDQPNDDEPQLESPQSEAEREQAGVTRKKGKKGAPYGRQMHGGHSYGEEGVAGQILPDEEDRDSIDVESPIEDDPEEPAP